jgi:hypothetical protein
MRWKGIIIIISVYLVIFGLIYVLLLPSEESENDTTAGDIFKEINNDLKSKLSFKNFKNPFNFLLDIKLKQYFLKDSCYFKRDFNCIYFNFDKEKNILIFNFKNTMVKTVFVQDLNLIGQINCSMEINELIDYQDDFFIKLEDCVYDGNFSRFKSKSSDMIINYHEGLAQFSKKSQGKLYVR